MHEALCEMNQRNRIYAYRISFIETGLQQGKCLAGIGELNGIISEFNRADFSIT